MTALIDRIEELFDRHGDDHYDGAGREPVSALEHALQTAQLAEWADAEESLVAAALLHDIGHFGSFRAAAGNDPRGDRHDDHHEQLALSFLAESFGPAVTEPIRLHVAAKRYLVATEPTYAEGLSPASVHSLALQGGPMSLEQRIAFEAERHAQQALRLRRWDDLAKQPGKTTPPLAYYLALLEDLLDRPFTDSKIGIGSLSVV